MESWRKFLDEEELDYPTQTNSKIIFMAGSPGSGKSTVLKGLGLAIGIVNADTFYEEYLSTSHLPFDLEAQYLYHFLISSQDN